MESSLLCLFCFIAPVGPARAFQAGPLFDEFDLTLTPGHRTEALGPFYYDQEKTGQHTWAIPPLFSKTEDPAVPLKEYDFLYPILTYDRYGDQYRWQFCQVLSFAGGPSQTETNRDRFTLFPIYFQQRSSEPNENYTAVLPFYGHLKHRLFRDETFFVMWPLYCQTRKKDVVTDNYLVPIFDVRRGDGLRGWQFWPLVGREHKDITTRINGFGDVTTVGGHDSFFAVWPLFINEKSGLGTTNPAWQQISLPAYAVLRSTNRDSTTILWPFFSHVTDREKKYKEWDLPWPLIVFARGEGKHTDRVWPIYSKAHSPTLESDFYLWPIYKFSRARLPPLDRQRTRIAFFLYSNLTEKNTDTGASHQRLDVWPLFTKRRDFNGNTRLQVLALIEPFVAGSHKIERDYSPLWSVWRSEHNARTGASSQSLLWNLYRHESGPDRKRTSVLFGLFQTKTEGLVRQTKLFFVPVAGGARSPASPKL